MKPQELRGGIETQLVRQDLSGSLEGAQRLGLSPLSVVGQHQEPPEALSPGVSCQQGLEVTDRPSLRSARQQPFDPDLLRLEAELIQARGLGHEGWPVDEVGEGRPAPKREGGIEGGDGDVGIRREGLPRIPHEVIEARGVQL